MRSTISRPVSCEFSSRSTVDRGSSGEPRDDHAESLGDKRHGGEAVPITVLQWLLLEIIDDSTLQELPAQLSCASATHLPNEASARHLFRAERITWKVPIPHRTTRHDDRRECRRMRHQQEGTVSVAPHPAAMTPADRAGPGDSSVATAAMLRQSIAVGEPGSAERDDREA
jgi:hypothetical protein